MPDGSCNEILVLLADDDPCVKQVFTRALQNNIPPVKLFTVANGKTALDYLLHRNEFSNRNLFPKPDLMFLDINMPVITGKQVMQELEQTDLPQVIPIIILTTSDLEEEATELTKLGCTDFFTKPAKLSDFVDLIQNTICKLLPAAGH